MWSTVRPGSECAISGFRLCSRLEVQKLQCRYTRRTGKIAPWIPVASEAEKSVRLSGPSEQVLHSSYTNAEGNIVAPPPFLATSPLVEQPWEYKQRENINRSRRCGLIVKKIGVFPQWLKSGKMVQTTLLQVLDNQVISYTDPETWYKQSPIGKKFAFYRNGIESGRLLIGAENVAPTTYTPAYRRKFELVGMPVKKHIAAFSVSPEAAIQPGTKLVAAHFSVGQLVSLLGRSIDWGFEGGVHRWGMHGGRPDSLGTTKSHRRVGSMGSTGAAKVLPGKRMPGHMGWEWVRAAGQKILRIDHKNQIIYVLGPGVPGDNGEVLRCYDFLSPTRKVKYEAPPFPTHLETDGGIGDDEMPSIQFELGEEVDYADAVRLAGVKKQAKVRGRK